MDQGLNLEDNFDTVSSSNVPSNSLAIAVSDHQTRLEMLEANMGSNNNNNWPNPHFSNLVNTSNTVNRFNTVNTVNTANTFNIVNQTRNSSHIYIAQSQCVINLNMPNPSGPAFISQPASPGNVPPVFSFIANLLAGLTSGQPSVAVGSSAGQGGVSTNQSTSAPMSNVVRDSTFSYAGRAGMSITSDAPLSGTPDQVERRSLLAVRHLRFQEAEIAERRRQIIERQQGIEDMEVDECPLPAQSNYKRRRRGSDDTY